METTTLESTETNKGKESLINKFREAAKAYENKCRPDSEGNKPTHQVKQHFLRQLHQFIEPIKLQIKNEADTKEILEWERRQGIISRADDYRLNEIDFNTIKKTHNSGEAQCHNKLPSEAYGVTIGDVIKFKTYTDEVRNEKMFIMYIPRVIEPEFQVGKELAFKIQHGFMPQPEDYAPAKTVYKRFMLKDSIFVKYFTIL